MQSDEAAQRALRATRDPRVHSLLEMRTVLPTMFKGVEARVGADHAGAEVVGPQRRPAWLTAASHQHRPRPKSARGEGSGGVAGRPISLAVPAGPSALADV